MILEVFSNPWFYDSMEAFAAAEEHAAVSDGAPTVSRAAAVVPGLRRAATSATGLLLWNPALPLSSKAAAIQLEEDEQHGLCERAVGKRRNTPCLRSCFSLWCWFLFGAVAG